MAMAADSGADTIEAVRDEIVKILSSIKVSDLELKKKAVILLSSTDCKKAIEILVENKVRAAPVIDADDKFLGVVDLRDTLQYVLGVHKAMINNAANKCDADNNNNNNDNNDDQKTRSNLLSLPSAIEYLTGSKSMMPKSLEDLCGNNSFRVISVDDTLLNLASIFAVGSHVVGIIDNDDKLLGVITQGYFFQQISKRWKFINNCSLNKLFEAKYITSPIQSIPRNNKAVQAFELMNNLNLSGLAVVDENGVLIHNTSATDIKLWLLKGQQSLEDTIEKFLINIGSLSDIGCSELKDEFKTAINKLQETKYHRLWIINDKKIPIGVLALTDIFRFIVGSNEKQKKKRGK